MLVETIDNFVSREIIMDRNEFIAAMIAELTVQKSKSKASDGSFFTGADLTPVDIYRKLCFDFPVVDDYMLEIFLGGLKRWATEKNEFRAVFAFNEKLLYNLTTLHDGHHGTLTDEDRAKMSRRQELASCIAVELYLGLPIHLLDLPFDQLANMFDLQSKGSVLHSEILGRFRAFLCHISFSQILGSLNSQYLSEGNLLSKALRTLDKFLSLYDKLHKSKDLSLQIDAQPKGLLHLVENIYYPMNPESVSEEREFRLSWLKDIVSHLSTLIVETLCVFPDLLPSIFSAFCAVHIGRSKHAPDPFEEESPLPSLGQYLLLMAMSRLSNAFNRKDHKIAGHKVKSALDAIRGQMAKSSLLTDLVEICVRIRAHNLPSSSAQTIQVVDLESSDFLVDMALLIVSEDLSPSPSAAFNMSSLSDACISSRLLAQLADLYVTMVLNYLDPAALPADLKRHDAQYWALSVRGTFALTRLVLWDTKLASFMISMPSVSNLSSTLLSATAERDSHWQIIRSNPPWRLVLGVTVFTAMVLKLSSQATNPSPSTIDLDGLLAMMKSGLELAQREVQEVNETISGLQARHERDQLDDVSAAEASSTERPEAGQIIAGYLRGIEAVEVCCRMMAREDLPMMLTSARKERQVATYLLAYQRGWASIVRALNMVKSHATNDRNDSLQVLIAGLERAIRSGKGLMSMLEGGITSKSD